MKNKKRILLVFSTLSVLGIVLSTILLNTKNESQLLKADEVSYGLILDASNTVNGADSYGATASGTVKTNSKYDVSISVGDFRANSDQAGVFRNDNGYVCNTTPVRGIKKLGICADKPVDVEVGYKVDDIIYWEFTSNLAVLDFNNGKSRMYELPTSTYPLNYFRFKAAGYTQVKKIEVYYSCGNVDKSFNKEFRLNLNSSYTDTEFALLVKSKKEDSSNLGWDNKSINASTANYDTTYATKINVQTRTDYTYEMALPKRNYWKPFEGFRFQINYANVVLKMDGNTVLTTTEATKNGWQTIMISADKKVFANGNYIYTLSTNKGNGTERIDVSIITNALAAYAGAQFTPLFAYNLA